jgi:hypothetical protein
MVFAPRGRRFDPERYSFMEPLKSSDYTQPPLLALSATEIFSALSEEDPDGAQLFLSEAYPYLDRFYKYFENHRQNSPTDPLIGIMHPHETGRDSDPTFDFIKLRLGRQGPATPKLIDAINSGADYASIIALNYRQRLAGWDEQAARANFWMNDVMFNCIYVDNLYQMSELAKALALGEDDIHYQRLAAKVEQRILDDMWFAEAKNGQGNFYALKEGSPILETSVSNLSALMLPHLRPEQLASILNLLETSFSSAYPIPSVATNSPNYDPHYQEKGRLWRGPTWINTNWYLVERGLQMQAKRPELAAYPDLIRRCIEFGNKVVDSSQFLVDQGYFEFYDSETGQPYRVDHFAWSALARLLKKQKPAVKAIAQ